MQATVIVRLDVVGFHAWPEAPASVGYLAHQHRHVFSFVIGALVESGERQIEYHTLKREALEKLGGFFDRNEHGEFLFGPRSCETLAHVAGSLLQAYRVPVRFVEVWEDNENGSRVEFGPLPPPAPAPAPAPVAPVDELPKKPSKKKAAKRGGRK